MRFLICHVHFHTSGPTVPELHDPGMLIPVPSAIINNDEGSMYNTF